MASQNLPGFAVLRGAGYEPPVRRALGVTGVLSSVAGLFGAHTISMAAITAAICLGEEVHPDRSRRWLVGLAYAAAWAGLGIFGTVILSAIEAVVLSTQHGPDVGITTLREAVMEEIVKPVLPAEWLTRDTRYHINPTGRFVVGGPLGDSDGIAVTRTMRESGKTDA